LAVQATLANSDEALLPGMFVNAAVVLPPEPDRVVLPETAIDFTLYGDSVYVVREDGQDTAGKPLVKAFRTPVKTGARWQGKVAVLSGVNAGDRVVAAGQIKLQDGAPVVVTDNRCLRRRPIRPSVMSSRTRSQKYCHPGEGWDPWIRVEFA